MKDTESGKRYQIFIAPSSPTELETLCFKPLTDGSTFCIDKNCIVNQRGDEERFLVAPGEVFIKFSKTIAYKDPSVNSLLWSDEVLDSWKDDSETMEVWMQSFRLVKGNLNQNPGLEINSVSIKQEQLLTEKGQTFWKCQEEKKNLTSRFQAHRVYFRM